MTVYNLVALHTMNCWVELVDGLCCVVYFSFLPTMYNQDDQQQEQKIKELQKLIGSAIVYILKETPRLLAVYIQVEVVLQ